MKSCPQKPMKQYSNIIYRVPLFCNIFFYYCIYIYLFLPEQNKSKTVIIYHEENLHSTVEISFKKQKYKNTKTSLKIITMENCQRVARSLINCQTNFKSENMEMFSYIFKFPSTKNVMSKC